MPETEILQARTVAVLADCHIHPGGGPDWTRAVLTALEGCDLIVTLGDMGESAGLDRLAQIAQVLGVAGADDQPDPRTSPRLRRLSIGGVALGCVFDPKAAGLAALAHPFEPAADFPDALARAFGGPVDGLLYASTHRPASAEFAGVWAVNPGSALLPDEGAKPAFARLTVENGRLRPEIVTLS
ncbi:MAG TPA: metallophosphoesterase family protein [Phenylobacterium sp.]|uniref:metallophosphoesterase family protein n=1 Tax=Phenylobacterium sp. TaxID=1871053 RepID=UPI002C0ED9CC|nr:metallophosphoesterase family protein [Phenylobacterium sp.]HSV01799.1 metallophosphoesterase family protein [Phenylobacterium sp.]